MLDGMVERGASDLFFKTGSPVRIKASGDVLTLKTEPLTLDEMDFICSCFLNDEQLHTFRARGEADAVHVRGEARYRLHFAYGHTGPYMAIRVIHQTIPAFGDLGLPDEVHSWMTKLKHGLLVVAGGTDAGKTLSCVSLIESINQRLQRGILTLEDPIEHVFMEKKSMIVQREVGLHTSTFAEGLRSALRENLDIIFVGELRGTDTIEQALRAGETGHLVLTTLHADDALSAVTRLIGSFPPNDQPRIRQSLAATFSGVVYQRLLPKREGGRVPCVETMFASTAVRTILRSGDLSKLTSYVGRSTGGLGYRECLVGLRKQGLIDPDVMQQETQRLQTGAL